MLSGQIRDYSDRPGEILISTEAESKQLLVLADSYHKGWRAELDGIECLVLRVYGDFMGCLVDAGAHEIRFSFKPPSFVIGKWVAGLASILALMFSFAPFLSRKPPARSESNRT